MSLSAGRMMPPVTEAEPDSVVTGRSIEQIAKSEDHVWNSKDTAGGGKAWFRQESKGDVATIEFCKAGCVGIKAAGSFLRSGSRDLCRHNWR